ncbi:hypothetical protein HK101_003690 [Irineochytrium annulatum]|nr:hypothetical protein HK101_003690 [Irineochytrium annulatum]
MPNSWKPSIGVSFQWQLDGDVYSAPALVYDGDPIASDFSPIGMHARGRAAICYVNVGSLESDKSVRPDFIKFPASVIGKAYPGWNEKFLDTRSVVVRSLMQARFQAAADAGCDGIEPDNIDNYTYDTGFNLTATDGLDYVTWISTTVRGMGMMIAQKNGMDLLRSQILFLTDFAIVEECRATKTCSLFAPYITQSKPVYAVEYTTTNALGAGCSTIPASEVPAACAELNGWNFEGVVKDCDLGESWAPCQAYVGGVRGSAVVGAALNGGSEVAGLVVLGGGVNVNVTTGAGLGGPGGKVIIDDGCGVDVVVGEGWNDHGDYDHGDDFDGNATLDRILDGEGYRRLDDCWRHVDENCEFVDRERIGVDDSRRGVDHSSRINDDSTSVIFDDDGLGWNRHINNRDDQHSAGLEDGFDECEVDNDGIDDDGGRGPNGDGCSAPRSPDRLKKPL